MREGLIRRGYSEARRGKLFRWTLAGRAKFLDDRLNCLESVQVLWLPGTAIVVLLPVVQIARAMPAQSLAQSLLAHVEDFRKPVVGIPRLLIEHVVRRNAR